MAAAVTAAEEAAVPRAFYDELYVQIGMNMNESILGSSSQEYYEREIADRMSKLLHMDGGPDQVTAELIRTANGEVAVMFRFKILTPGTISPKEVQEALDFKKNPQMQEQLREELSTIVPPDGEGFGFEIVLFNPVDSVVFAILHNPGVAKAYKFYFAIGTGLFFAVVFILWHGLRNRHSPHVVPERTRGRLVMPIFVTAILFQSVVACVKSCEKYMMLVEHCRQKSRASTTFVDIDGTCPPSRSALVGEIAVFVVFVCLGLLAFVVWWWPRWSADCTGARRVTRQAELAPVETESYVGHGMRPMSTAWSEFVDAPKVGDLVEVLWCGEWVKATLLQDLGPTPIGVARWIVHCENDAPGVYVRAHGVKLLQLPPSDSSFELERTAPVPPRRPTIFDQRNVLPMESVMRRGQILTWLVVRPTDTAQDFEQFLLVLIDLGLSFGTVMTSFFLLQKYEVPGMLTAWFPYKVIFELVVASILRIFFRKMVTSGSLSPETQTRFTKVSILVVFAYDVWLWSLIGVAVAQSAPPLQSSWSQRLRILDITVGAGLVNFLLSRFCVTIAMLLASAYIYEPMCRHRYRRTVHLTSMKQARTLLKDLGPHAPRLRMAQPPDEASRRCCCLGGWPHGADADKEEEFLNDVESDVEEDDDLSPSELERHPWKVDDKPQMLTRFAKKGIRVLKWRQLLAPLQDDFDASRYARCPSIKRTFNVAADDSDESESDEESKASELDDGLHGMPVIPTVTNPIVVTVRLAASGMLRQLLVEILDLALSVDALLPVALSDPLLGRWHNSEEEEDDDEREADSSMTASLLE